MVSDGQTMVPEGLGMGLDGLDAIETVYTPGKRAPMAQEQPSVHTQEQTKSGYHISRAVKSTSRPRDHV